MIIPMGASPSLRAVRTVTATLMLALVLSLMGPSLVGPGTAWAQDSGFPNSAIGIIDMQRILRESTAARGVDKDRQTYLEAYNKKTAGEEQALREKQRELAIPPNQQPTAEDEQKARQFRQEVSAFEKRVAERRRSLERALSQALGQVQKTITVIADEVAAERGINLVLYRSQVPLFDPRMEMTDDVLKRLNERLKSVTFPDPASLAKTDGQ